MRVLHLVPGPDRHGVTRHALGLLSRPPLAHHDVRRVGPDDSLTGEYDLVHLHLTDHLLAPSAGECACVVVRAAQSHPMSLTLHDLPQPADGPGRYERRRAAYAAMASNAVGVVVASEHERRLLIAAADAERVSRALIEVVPLPIDSEPSNGPRTPPSRRQIVVFGYVYPGKGHRQVVDALVGLPEDVGVLALGMCSPGHEHLGEGLIARGLALGREVTLTGYLPDDAVADALRAASVPAAPHLHVSASGSINTWLAVGRRPLVPDGPYVRELEARCPGALFRYGPGLPHPDLTTAVRAALANPDLTWLNTPVGPTSDEAADALARRLDLWAEGAS